MFFFDVVYLSHITFYSLWAVVVFFPPLWVFHVTSCVSTLFLFSVSFSCIHSRCSVVAERTGERISTLVTNDGVIFLHLDLIQPPLQEDDVWNIVLLIIGITKVFQRSTEFTQSKT